MKLIKSTLYLQAGLQILNPLVFSALMLTLSIAPDAAYKKPMVSVKPRLFRAGI